MSFRQSDEEVADLTPELGIGDRVAFRSSDNIERIGRVVSFIKLTGPGTHDWMQDGVSIRAENEHGGGLYTTSRTSVRFIRKVNV